MGIRRAGEVLPLLEGSIGNPIFVCGKETGAIRFDALIIAVDTSPSSSIVFVNYKLLDGHDGTFAYDASRAEFYKDGSSVIVIDPVEGQLEVFLSTELRESSLHNC